MASLVWCLVSKTYQPVPSKGITGTVQEDERNHGATSCVVAMQIVLCSTNRPQHEHEQHSAGGGEEKRTSA